MAQKVEAIAGRRIVLSAGTGKTNPDELKKMTAEILAKAAPYKMFGWGYIADCTKMDAVGPAEGAVLVEMTKSIVAAGCKAIAFIDGNSAMLKVQAKKNTRNAHADVVEGHFATIDEALAWLKSDLHI